jgi:nucleolar protein 56
LSLLPRFGKFFTTSHFIRTAAHALENMMNVTEAVVHTHLSSFLELNLPKSGNAVLGVSDRNFAGMRLPFILHIL